MKTMSNAVRMDEQARPVPRYEQKEDSKNQAEPVRPLEKIYEDIARRDVRSLEDLHTLDQNLIDELAEAVVTYTRCVLRGKLFPNAWELCRIGCLKMDDLTNELAAKLFRETCYVTAKAPNERMTSAFGVMNRCLTDLWRSQTKHFGKEELQEDGQRIFVGGYYLASYEEMTDTGRDPQEGRADRNPPPEEEFLFQESAKEVFRIIQAQKLSERQMAAFLQKAWDNGLDPAVAHNWRDTFLRQLQAKGADSTVIKAWSNGFGARFKDARAKANALYIAGKKLGRVRHEIYQVFDLIPKAV